MRIRVIFLLVLLSFVLTGCVSIDSIRNNFENDGYVYNESPSKLIDSFLDKLESESIQVNACYYTKEFKTAIILEFDSSKELQNQLENNEDIQTMILNLQQSELVRGNILLIPIAITSDARQQMIDIFNE